MRVLAVLLLSLLASIASADASVGLPKCAKSCVGTSYGGCGLGAIHCICSNKPFLAKLACCVSKNCSEADQKKTIQFADALCASADVTDLPKSATCAATLSGSASSSSSAAQSTTTNGAVMRAAGAEGSGLGLLLAGLAAVAL